MEQRGIHLSFRALYVESDPNTFDRLESFIRARTPEGIQAKPMKGDFVALRPEILQWCGERSFVFFFIDPTGWTEVAVRTLQPLLQRRRSEFLINFMYDFVNRTVSMQAWQEEMATLLGEPVNLDGMNARERERVLLETYRRNLKRQMGFDVGQPRSAYVRVLDREKERPKYHLVYLTNHPRGIIEFMEISEGLDIVQKRVRAETKRAARATKSGMGDLFDAESYIDAQDGHASIEEVEEFWITYLSDGEKTICPDHFADLLERTNWFPGDLQRALRKLIDTGKVRNLEERHRRPKKPLHWWKCERLLLARDSQ
jgi:three-Cys-motif partner protein